MKLSQVVSVQAIVDDPLMRHSAVLVFANKQDMVRPLPLFTYSGCRGHGLCLPTLWENRTPDILRVTRGAVWDPLTGTA